MVASLSETSRSVFTPIDGGSQSWIICSRSPTTARKLGLGSAAHERYCSPTSETSKVSACVRRMSLHIWQRTARSGKSTQMVFCDLSLRRTVTATFNVYDDVRNQADCQTAFRRRKSPLSMTANYRGAKERAVCQGAFRPGAGASSAARRKMGAGTNVQDKAWWHSITWMCPWRPSDLQQRERPYHPSGQPKTRRFRYLQLCHGGTPSTAYLYQTGGKQAEVHWSDHDQQIPGSLLQRTWTRPALSYAEIKALCAGNPHIKEKMDSGH